MSLRLKTIIGVALIEAIALAILVSLTLNYLKTTNYDGLNQRVISTTRLLEYTVKNAVLSYDLATIESLTQELVTESDIVYVAVFGEGGQLLSEQGQTPSGYSVRILEESSKQVKDGIFDVKQDIREAGITFGSVWLGFDMTKLNSQIKEAQKWTAIIVLGEMSLVALFSYILGAYLTKRLTQLRDAADQIANGHRDVDLNIAGKDEVSTVSQAFMNMVERLAISEKKAVQYQQQLEQANESLESKVAQRTQALLESNRKLTKLNQELKSTQEKLVESEKMASIGTMAAGFSHEINNPIGVVNSNLQVSLEYLSIYQDWIALLKEPDKVVDSEMLKKWEKNHHVQYLHEDFKACLLETKQCVDRVKGLVDALQKYSANNHEGRSDFKPIELFELVHQALSNIQVANNVEINIHSSVTKAPLLLGSESELVKLFIELFKNAVNSCSCLKERSGHIQIKAKQMDNSCLVDIEDNGVGIKSEWLKRLFDPFFTTAEVGHGMGLGLTYCYDIIKHHKGEIEIKNREEHGVVVTLTLPCVTKEISQ